MSSPSKGANWLEDHLRQSAAASYKESSRLDDEAYGTDRAAKRLREQADELDQQTKRFKDDSEDAMRLKHSLEFEALCLALRRDDAATKNVTCDRAFPVGYGEALGKALHRNTHVSSMLLRLNELVPGLGENELHKINLGPLLTFIAKSNSMRHVIINQQHESGQVSFHLSKLLLKAVFGNRNHIDSLILAVPQFCCVDFERCMRSTMLRTLDIDFGEEHSYDTDDRRLIGEAFRQSASLYKLSFATPDARLARAILLGLSLGHDRYQLRDLKVSCTDETQNFRYWAALSEFLTNKGGPLDHLHLEFARLDETGMANLIIGLRGMATSETTLSKLTFDNCHIDGDASELLISFMQTKVDNKSKSVLRELAINDFKFKEWHGLDLVSMLCMQPESQAEAASKWHSTIGSKIQSLSISPCYPITCFLQSLAEHAEKIQLQKLHVDSLGEDNCVELGDCISEIPSLRELVVEGTLYYDRIIASLKENGNIHRVSFPNDKQSIEYRLARAYADRNRLLEPLLQETTALEPTNDDPNGPTPQSLDGKMNLCPSLLEASTQISNTRSATLSRTLLQLQDSIGPR